jgi:hypothetical protein
MHDKLARAVVIVLGTLLAGAFPGCNCSHPPGLNRDLGAGNIEDLAAVSFDIAPPTPSSDGGCSPGGDSCTSNAACCSGYCDPVAHLCSLAACLPSGAACIQPTDCCDLNCSNGACATAACISDGQSCTAGGAACCSTQCVGGTCQPLNPMCKTAGNICSGDGDCCSKTCTAGKCAAPSTVSYCTQVGDICFHDNDCCTGVCTIASGATAGTCANLNGPCEVDGTVCNGCQGCCSSFCAPFGTGPSKICQPAGGCHVLGDLCLADIDCCGGNPNDGLPGSGLVRCIRNPQFPQIGTCSMANVSLCPLPRPPTCHNSCQPEGDVCHFKNNGGCPSNSFPNDCCGAPGNKGMCQLDAHGVPRCHGIAACVMPGGNCAAQSDCCNGVPCVPGPGGQLTCATTSCVPQGNTCTATSDCCAGYICVVPPGSTTGTCINPNPQPMVPADMAGTNGMFDLSTPPPTCSLVAQSCSATQPCCMNNGTCKSQSTGVTCTTETDCICVQPIL